MYKSLDLLQDDLRYFDLTLELEGLKEDFNYGLLENIDIVDQCLFLQRCIRRKWSLKKIEAESVRRSLDLHAGMLPRELQVKITDYIGPADLNVRDLFPVFPFF